MAESSTPLNMLHIIKICTLGSPTLDEFLLQWSYLKEGLCLCRSGAMFLQFFSLLFMCFFIMPKYDELLSHWLHFSCFSRRQGPWSFLWRWSDPFCIATGLTTYCYIAAALALSWTYTHKKEGWYLGRLGEGWDLGCVCGGDWVWRASPPVM